MKAPSWIGASLPTTLLSRYGASSRGRAKRTYSQTKGKLHPTAKGEHRWRRLSYHGETPQANGTPLGPALLAGKMDGLYSPKDKAQPMKEIAMETRTLGKDGPEVPIICFGA